MNLTELRKILTTRLDENELRDLCFDLDIDYDGLPGEGKTGKARELIAYLERRKRLHDLIKVGRQERPDISWPEATGLAQAGTTSDLPPTRKQPAVERGFEQVVRPATPTESPRQLKVFLCHASGDKPTVRDLYHRLRADGIDPWFYEENLLPGQDWQLEIPKAVRSSDAVIICLSRKAITKAGYVQKEIKYALDVADEQPEGTIFLIPLRLEECDVPERLRRWQWVDLFRETGYERLLRALRARAESLGLDTHPVGSARDRWRNPRDGKEMVRVPAGKFLYGDDRREVELPEFWIDKAPVTNAEYARFVAETRHKPPAHWEGKTPAKKIADHPVVNVSWDGATAYAAWAGGFLPTEEEWEKAARGTDGREYPWGEWAEGRCNSKKAGIGGTTPVGKYSPQGDSPYGCVDMAGNVWEWTASKHEHGGRVLRGGAFDVAGAGVRCAFRLRLGPHSWDGDVGFRVAVARAPG